MKKSKKFLAMIFSAIPGAGHMYIGLQKQGLQYMSIFFFIIFLNNSLDIGFLMFILPIIWFYSFFDMLNKTSIDGPLEDDNIIFIAWLGKKDNWFKEKNKLAGYLLVAIGAILIFQKFVLYTISWEYRNYIETATLGILFIIGGIKLLMGSKTTTKAGLEDDKS